ncbi:hypothetical protein WHI96_14030 [Pseudonocardia tropica]|uniref:Uncharacterized protein n=1 Tax=Pseudonocardia tropica TaxID=681289 RepID=A0ABV1JVI4_9PSEU
MAENHPHDGPECRGCEWEHQPQAFRWFPELGAPLDPAGTNTGRFPGRAA